MEKNYIFSKATNLNATKWNEVTLNVYKDEIIIFYDIKKKNKECYHITRIKSLILKKIINEDYDYDDEEEIKKIKLKITFDMNQPIILRSEKSNSKIFELRRILNTKKLEYYINICNNLFSIENAKSFFTKELEINLKNYISNESFNEINKKLNKEKNIINEKIDLIKRKYNNINEILNSKIEFENNDFIPNLFEITIKNSENNFDINNISKISEYFYKLVNILSFIKKYEIRRNHNILDDPFNDKLIRINDENNKNDKLNNNSLNDWINITTPGNSESNKEKIKRLKEKNTILKNKLLVLLNKNSLLKENLKKKISKSNIKIHLCYKCNNILQRTEKLDSNCNFDLKCTKLSLFYCIRCKINFCTYCVVYQNYSKCGNNHTLYPSLLNDQGYQCLICSSYKFPFYICSHCTEEFCFDCSNIGKGKELNCISCSSCLHWRKYIYNQCFKCKKMKPCFWFCITCDYNFCLDCYSIFNGKCGNFHPLKYFNLEFLRSKNNYRNDFFICNKYELKFLGKCNKCESILTSGDFYTCGRCSLFLCPKCGKCD